MARPLPMSTPLYARSLISPVRTQLQCRIPCFRQPQHRPKTYWQFPQAQNTRPQYNRFNRAQSIRYLWQTSPTFRRVTGAIGGTGVTFYVYNLETVPVSGRKRFNWVPKSYEEDMGTQLYQQVLEEYKGKLQPAWHSDSKMVHRVLNRLIPASGLQDAKWEVNVIDDDSQMNAFVIPGGKVFVFSGILPICQSDDGLASVLGHEIAHNVAHHSAENMSRMSLLLPLVWAGSLLFDVSGNVSYLLLDYIYQKPGSRKQESEADYIGLMMMAQSCYDPEAAVGLWQRMEKAEKVAIPQFMSTHPSSHNRVEKIQTWLPQARARREESQCGNTTGVF